MNNRNGNSRFVTWTWWASLVLVAISAAIALVLLLTSCSMKGLEGRIAGIESVLKTVQKQEAETKTVIHASEGSEVTSINLTFLGQSAGWLCVPIVGFMFIQRRIALGALDRLLDAIDEQGEGDTTKTIKNAVRSKGWISQNLGPGSRREDDDVDFSEKLIRKRLRKGAGL